MRRNYLLSLMAGALTVHADTRANSESRVAADDTPRIFDVRADGDRRLAILSAPPPSLRTHRDGATFNPLHAMSVARKRRNRAAQRHSLTRRPVRPMHLR